MPIPVYHYTTGDRLLRIIASRAILPATAHVDPTEIPAVWLSSAPVWEPSATIRISSPPADAHRKRRVTALLETAVEGIACNRYCPQPAMQCSWCQFKNECMAWLPGMTVEEVRRAA